MHSLYKFYGALCIQILLPPCPENPSYAPRTLAIKSASSSDYSEDRVGALLNVDLADTLGNLLLRVTSRKLHPQGPGVSFSTELFPLGDSERGGHGVRAGEEDYTFVNNLIDLPRMYISMYKQSMNYLLPSFIRD